MSNTIEPNYFYRNIFNSRIKTKEDITEAEHESFYPLDSKGWDQSITAKDLFDNPTPEDEETFDKKWINKTSLEEEDTNYKSPNYFIDYLVSRGRTKEESERIVNYTIENVERQKDWSERNETRGKIASYCMDGIIGLGIIEKLIDSESVPKVIRTSASLAYAALRGKRDYEQNTIYRAPDDDASLNNYQADLLGNKVSGNLGNLATTLGTKVNFWAYPLAEVLPERFRSSIKQILFSFVPVWFRGRQPAEIRQSFFTDLNYWLFHKIPSMFGVKKSVEVVEGINNRGSIKFSYFWKRLCILAGINDKEDHTLPKYIKQVFKLIRGCASNDLKAQKDSYTKLGKTIAPPLGMYGFYGMGIGTIVSAALKIFNIENKFVNFTTSSSIESQQFIYFPKLVMPLFTIVKELEASLSSPDFRRKYKSDGKIKEVRNLCGKYRKLGYLGVGCLLLNGLNVLLKLKNFENPILKKIVEVIDELSTNLISKFFSYRRHLLGLDFRLTNSEFYDEES